jgi:hypothetical protein
MAQSPLLSCGGLGELARAPLSRLPDLDGERFANDAQRLAMLFVERGPQKRVRGDANGAQFDERSIRNLRPPTRTCASTMPPPLVRRMPAALPVADERSARAGCGTRHHLSRPLKVDRIAEIAGLDRRISLGDIEHRLHRLGGAERFSTLRSVARVRVFKARIEVAEKPSTLTVSPLFSSVRETAMAVTWYLLGLSLGRP